MLMPKTTLVAILVALIALLGLASVPEQAQAVTWNGPVSATWYGPDYYWNTFACAGRRAPDGTSLPRTYDPRTRGVAMDMPLSHCGRKYTIRKWGRIIRVRMIDRCPGCTGIDGLHPFDLTARSAMDLICGRGNYCRPYTQQVRWHRGW